MQPQQGVGVVTVANIQQKTNLGKGRSLKEHWAVTAETIYRRVLVGRTIEYQPEPT